MCDSQTQYAALLFDKTQIKQAMKAKKEGLPPPAKGAKAKKGTREASARMGKSSNLYFRASLRNGGGGGGRGPWGGALSGQGSRREDVQCWRGAVVWACVGYARKKKDVLFRGKFQVGVRWEGGIVAVLITPAHGNVGAISGLCQDRCSPAGPRSTARNGLQHDHQHGEPLRQAASGRKCTSNIPWWLHQIVLLPPPLPSPLSFRMTNSYTLLRTRACALTDIDALRLSGKPSLTHMYAQNARMHAPQLTALTGVCCRPTVHCPTTARKACSSLIPPTRRWIKSAHDPWVHRRHCHRRGRTASCSAPLGSRGGKWCAAAAADWSTCVARCGTPTGPCVAKEWMHTHIYICM